MGVFIGMDEAGYGPNLGPLVITTTAWEVPGRPQDFDWWTELADAVTNVPERGDTRLHVADSKAVYSPSKGLASLERSVLALLGSQNAPPDGFRQLWASLVPSDAFDMDAEPWFAERDTPLPLHPDAVDGGGEVLSRALEKSGVKLLAIRSEIVLVRRFNELVRASGSKGVTLSSLSARLLRSVWEPGSPEPTLVVADKHGGRNRYDDVLAEILDGEMVLRLDEGRELSRYRIGATEVRFQTKAEAWFPVAFASMVSKYVRELSMSLFNSYWREHVPDVKPTKGYPSDAKRFRADVDEARKRLGIEDEVFWRER